MATIPIAATRRYRPIFPSPRRLRWTRRIPVNLAAFPTKPLRSLLKIYN
jgi:hypothetical protein